MRTIKFTSDKAWQKKFAAAVRRNVNNYFEGNGISTKGNFTLLTQTIGMLSLYIIPFVFLLTISMNLWASILLVITMGIGMAGIGMCVMHDAVHGSYSIKEWVNKLIEEPCTCWEVTYLLGKYSII